MTPAPVVIQAEHLADEAAAWLGDRCELVRCAPDDPSFDARLARAAGLVVRTYTRVDRDLLAAAPALRVVGRAGVGLDNIDVAACRARGVEVVYTPDANTQAVGEYVIALVLDAVRPRPRLTRAVGMDEWRRLRARHVGHRQLDEMTLGVLGLGRTGGTVARLAGGLGVSVVFNDLLEIEATRRHGARPVALEELFDVSDVVSIHVDGRPGNRGFVGANLLARLRDDAVLVNTSRGFVVDNDALAAFLDERPAARALLDVHEPEPFGADHPLLGRPNAELMPHLAGRTDAALRTMSWVVRDVLAVLEGRAPVHPAPPAPGAAGRAADH